MASSVWRSVAGNEEGFAPWVRKLRGKSGVYLIRRWPSGTLLYVGESHKNGRLYKTLVRHFQSSSDDYRGPTYYRTFVEVRVILTAPSRAVELQDRLIRKLQPADNKTGKLEAAPF